MKNIRRPFIALLLTCFVLASCDEDILNTKQQDGAVSEEEVYSQIDTAESLVQVLYNSTESWALRRNEFWGQRINLEGASFEAKFNFQNRNDVYNLRDAGWTPGNPGLVFSSKWESYFYYVQGCNEFLSKIEGSPAQGQDEDKARVLIAEARFLRANLYSKLLRFFGGVPIFTSPNELNGNYDFTRDSYEDCVKFIVSELDAVAQVLPQTRPAGEFGRATSVAALAVKSRTLLYAASDLHDPSKMPQTENIELYSYPVSSKWQDAADAAKAVIDIVGDDALIQVADATEYQSLFLSPNENILFARPYSSTIYETGTGGFNAVNSLPDQAQSPNGYTGWGLCSPTHDFALEFNFADGSTTGGVTPANPHENREMRYYADLTFQGALFRRRPVDYALSDTIPGENRPAFRHGLDSPEGRGNTQHSSKTGYNIRKFHDESIRVLTEISPDRPYILYRVAEIYLNYAEAMAELEQDGIALNFLNKVSRRALQPNIVAGGEALKEAIKRERRVELCFEGHNFFDERRWLNEDHLGFDIRGLKYTKKIDGTVPFENVSVVVRPWFPKMYYLPIPENENEISPGLTQNFGYN